MLRLYSDPSPGVNRGPPAAYTATGGPTTSPVAASRWRLQTSRPARRAHPPRDRDERDERLARRALEDRSAFSALYEAHAGRVYRYLLSRTSDPAEAEELTSRVFLNALAGLDQYRGRGAGFSSWLMSIAHNLLVNWYRDRGRRPAVEALDAAADVASEVPGPESSLEQNELIAQVRAAISSLSPERQELIALKYVDGRTNAEIGRMMGRTEGAVKALHHRTLRELHALLAEVVEDDSRPSRERTRR